MPKATRDGVLASLAIVLLASTLVWQQHGRGRERDDRVIAAYARGIAFLAKTQSASGEFPTYRWYPGNETAEKEAVTAVFTAAQMVHSLKFAEDGAPARLIRERAVAFLLAHRDPPGVWRYYGKGSDIFADVDDTAMAWAALIETGHAIDGSDLGALRASRTEDGLFNTWMGDPAAWRKFDPRAPDMNVNINALFLFALMGEPLPEVCRQAVASTVTKAFLGGTTWYPSPLAYTYFLSRAYADGGAACLETALSEVRSYVLAQQQADGGWGDDLETALGVLTLLNTRYKGPALERGVSAILTRQGPDGAWSMAPHYSNGNQPPMVFGSQALTTGFCLEALGKILWR